MAELLREDNGLPIPQYSNELGTNFEAIKGKDGAQYVRIKDAQNETLGSILDPDTADTLVGVNKKLRTQLTSLLTKMDALTTIVDATLDVNIQNFASAFGVATEIGKVTVKNVGTGQDLGNVTVANPVSTVSVSNLATAFGVAVELGLVTVKNVGTGKDLGHVTVDNPVSSVSVSNLATAYGAAVEIGLVTVKNVGTGKDLGNVTVANPVSTVSVSNQPTEIAVNNQPVLGASLGSLIGAQTVTVTAAVVKVGAAELVGRKSVKIFNNGATTVYVGFDGTVTSTTGLPVPAAGNLILDLNSAQVIPVYIIGTADTDVRIMEIK